MNVLVAGQNEDRREFASRFEVTQNGGSYSMHLDLKKECDICVQACHWDGGFRCTTLGKGRLEAGPFTFKIQEREIPRGLTMILVTLAGREYCLQQIESTSRRESGP
jgi:hypothetical protein